MRGRGAHPLAFVVPPVLLAAAFVLGVGMQLSGAFAVLLALGVLSVPALVALRPALCIVVAVPGYRLQVRVPRDRHEEAYAFMGALDHARAALTRDHLALEPVLPTARAFAVTG
jgi:hypothetical protein